MLPTFKKLARAVLPGRLATQAYRYYRMPIYGRVRFGSLKRITPIQRGFSSGRGTYIDRYYIDKFLSKHAEDVRGRVLDLCEDGYTRQFGGSKVTHSDVLDVRPGHPGATIIADLTKGEEIPSDAFDCVILTQTLNFIYDTRAAIGTVHRILKPGGVVLVSVPGICQVSMEEVAYCGDFWRFTHLSLRRLFEEFFPSRCITVETGGNVFAATAFLYGISVEELPAKKLEYNDPDYQLSVLLRAVKPLEEISSGDNAPRSPACESKHAN